ncbi:CCA tRNA nucleotidyltransferase [Helicobacter monodelphidis]|uniref:CCA tRNA nucleotidyltransferase n=1 Tax=Helicobacter sp. 15-1451 TaxID=2004995 RepID=UPI000DCBDD22|nr:CCA tRNA nucleotidyltransferase [Helicobacter sp. 15-1451]RAX58226.1 CCA tRNA nucleotidyltransferase [Helicobacter sp. 15-1451]
MFSIAPFLIDIFTILKKYHFEGYLVGGCVRDMLLGVPPKDYDITTNATPTQMKEIFSPHFYVIESGIAHGTLSLFRKDFGRVEITTYRSDGEYINHRHPRCVKLETSLKQDLARRDFTINALAYDPFDNTTIIDLYGGQDDLQHKIIRAIGSPHARFSEDALRILRALRFASEKNFIIETSCAEALYQQHTLLQHISVERIREEWNRILLGESAFKVINHFFSLFQNIFPYLKTQKQESLESLQYAPYDLIVRLCLTFQQVPMQDIQSFLNTFKYDNHTKKIIYKLLNAKPIQSSKISLKHLAHELSISILDQLIAIQEAQFFHKQQYKQELQHTRILLAEIQKECYTYQQLQINGKDLLMLGFPASSIIAKTLQEILFAVIEEKIPNERTHLIEFAKQFLKN